MKNKKLKFSKAEIRKYEWAIPYIKKEIADGRHPIASLGSAGYTFISDINRLIDYAESIGDKEFCNISFEF
jgi:hypothetical protein